MNHIVKRANVPVLVKRLRQQRKKIVFTNGVFDILHRGHVDYLRKARSFGDVLIVGMRVVIVLEIGDLRALALTNRVLGVVGA
ncbi:MAG: adenylyltransferase/cytidyltransferase family protein [Gemmatimonadetes bacterium]|nr:adenylyltransferase/cytidyltransferase family protein [Gemmatimonadota bacterium]